MSPIIKVCGMRDADNIRAVEALRDEFPIDMMGFIFWPHSSRYVTERPAYLPKKVKRVGVFVDETIENVLRITKEYSLDYIQLHGHESPDYIRALSVDASSPSIIKAFNIATTEDLKQTEPYEGLVDFFLFDTKGPSVGGNGQHFDWEVLSDYNGDTPFLLSGGIGPDDVEALSSLTSKKCIGIDINSRFELSPALKDVEAIRRFLSQLLIKPIKQ